MYQLEDVFRPNEIRAAIITKFKHPSSKINSRKRSLQMIQQKMAFHPEIYHLLRNPPGTISQRQKITS
jgi:hypothetical protein